MGRYLRMFFWGGLYFGVLLIVTIYGIGQILKIDYSRNILLQFFLIGEGISFFVTCYMFLAEAFDKRYQGKYIPFGVKQEREFLVPMNLSSSLDSVKEAFVQLGLLTK